MSTTMLAFTLLAGLCAGSGAPAWHHDYYRCQQLSMRQQKPLAIVLGKGAGGWDQIALEGKLSAAVLKLLADNYLCVYVDTTLDHNQELAAALNLRDGVGLVLGDRTGERQAFWHAGQLAQRDLARYLQKYADPKLVVTYTERHGATRTSLYPSGDSVGRETGGTGALLEAYCPT
ncbi:MAG: hypothetical protein NZ700_09140 [Gemmataceae bacterium]|nr:hypothetical protein [Gemmataceae bacterium]